MQTFDNLKEHYENNMNIDSKNTRKKTATFVRLTRCFCQVIKKKNLADVYSIFYRRPSLSPDLSLFIYFFLFLCYESTNELIQRKQRLLINVFKSIFVQQ